MLLPQVLVRRRLCVLRLTAPPRIERYDMDARIRSVVEGLKERSGPLKMSVAVAKGACLNSPLSSSFAVRFGLYSGPGDALGLA